MKFLLTAVNAKFIHSNPGLYSIQAYAGKAYAENFEIAEYTINQRVEQVLADLYNRKPRVIGFSCYIWNWTFIQEILPEIPKILPDAQIWLGGPEVSFNSGEILEKFPCLTGIMIGEGEETCLEILQFYLGERTGGLFDIKGIILPSGATGARTLTDLSKMPFIYEDLNTFDNRIIYYESSRGCPFQCSYCLSSIDKSVRLRDIELVKQELAFFLSEKVSQVKFIDRTFNCNHTHCKEIWSYILEHDNGITNFHFEIAADLLDEQELALLAQMRPGLVQLEIGVQTTNPNTLYEIKRYMDIVKLRYTVAQIQKSHNIHVHLDLIAGLPYENYESFKKSFCDVYAMKPEQLQLGFLKVLKGSYMHDMAEEYGIVYLDKTPYEVLSTRWLAYDEVLRLHKIEEMVEIYYNSNQYAHILPILETMFADSFSFYEALADYYEEKGYFYKVPARNYRYQVLLDFAMSIDKEHALLYKEALTYDIYLRENAKSRPSFAKNIMDKKQDFYQFFCDEDHVRGILPHYEEHDMKQISKMTHLDWFSYPVWDPTVSVQKKPLEQETMVLFDYKVRSSLTGDVSTYLVNI
ncbi:MAG: B12-binding domain-containing radical SAM protein [Lachnospiraceae bacterium]